MGKFKGWVFYCDEAHPVGGTSWGKTLLSEEIARSIAARRAYERGYADGWTHARDANNTATVTPGIAYGEPLTDTARLAQPEYLVEQDPEDLDLEELITVLYHERYRDIVKYLVVNQLEVTHRNLSFSAVHPARSYDMVGRGDTWEDAARDLLYGVISTWNRAQAGRLS